MVGTANDLNITEAGYVSHNGLGIFHGRTFQAGTGITISNPDGISGNTTIGLTGGSIAVEHLTGNTGGSLNPDGSNNFNIVGTGSITIAGSSSTLTSQLTGLTNHAIQIGAGTATLTQLAIGSTGQVLQANSAADPSWSTATYPSTAGTSGNVLTSDGTNFISSAPVGGILVASGNITNSEIKALHGTPKQIIANPGVGKVIQVLHGVMTMNYGGNNPFVNGGGGAISIFYSTTQSILQLLNSGQITASSSQIIMGAAPSLIAVAYTAITNLAVNIYSLSATEISGNAANDNTMSYNVVYRIITIP